MVGVDAADLAEIVFCGAGAPCVKREVVGALDDFDAIKRGRDRDGAATAAKRTVAAARGVETIREFDGEFNCTAVACKFMFHMYFIFVLRAEFVSG